jgi:hypothetical protein
MKDTSTRDLLQLIERISRNFTDKARIITPSIPGRIAAHFALQGGRVTGASSLSPITTRTAITNLGHPIGRFRLFNEM